MTKYREILRLSGLGLSQQNIADSYNVSKKTVNRVLKRAKLWDSKYAHFYDDFYENYKQMYEIIKKQREIAKRDEISSTEKYKLEPNSMQVGFITNLRRIVDAGENRALLISATGAGGIIVPSQAKTA